MNVTFNGSDYHLANTLGIVSRLHGGYSGLDAYSLRFYDGATLEPLEAYLGAAYWAVMTLTSIGYGDVVPEATIERFAVIWLMFFGGLVWAVVLGKACG